MAGHERKFSTKMLAESFYSQMKYDLGFDCEQPIHEDNGWVVKWTACPTCTCNE
tara:strand:+ start:154 stop:315 length:162 start_codon:yes stop_codon:yes gene_type:complete